jgi:chromosome segregation ATPase
MTAPREAVLLETVDELQRRDEAVAAEIAELEVLAAETAALRAGAGEVDSALRGLPAEVASVEASAAAAREAEAAAGAELREAAERLAGLEAARRRKGDEIAAARTAKAVAEQSLADASRRVERLGIRRDELRGEERTLQLRATSLLASAGPLAARLRASPGVMEAAGQQPGDSLAELEHWGSRARAALVVARARASSERERIVNEASALVASVVGEASPGVSVALARQRLVDALRS